MNTIITLASSSVLSENTKGYEFQRRDKSKADGFYEQWQGSFFHHDISKTEQSFLNGIDVTKEIMAAKTIAIGFIYLKSQKNATN